MNKLEDTVRTLVSQKNDILERLGNLKIKETSSTQDLRIIKEESQKIFQSSLYPEELDLRESRVISSEDSLAQLIEEQRFLGLIKDAAGIQEESSRQLVSLQDNLEEHQERLTENKLRIKDLIEELDFVKAQQNQSLEKKSMVVLEISKMISKEIVFFKEFLSEIDYKKHPVMSRCVGVSNLDQI